MRFLKGRGTETMHALWAVEVVLARVRRIGVQHGHGQHGHEVVLAVVRGARDEPELVAGCEVVQTRLPRVVGQRVRGEQRRAAARLAQ